MESMKIVKGTLREYDFALQPLTAEIAEKLKAALEEKGIDHCYTEDLDFPCTDILSVREIEIMLLACDEFVNKQIAAKLNISTRTVEQHRKNIYRKTGVTCILGLLKYAIKNGYYPVPKRVAA